MNTSPNSGGNPLRGFTLLELLVVIAIIAVLAGLLLPVLSTAKRKGQSVVTLNNLCQLGLGFTMYADDHQGRLPSHTGAWGLTGKDESCPSWVGGLLRIG